MCDIHFAFTTLDVAHHVVACTGNGAGVAQPAAFNLKGLWDSLPLSLFLQTCGTSASRDAIAELDPDEDKVMGKCSNSDSPQAPKAYLLCWLHGSFSETVDTLLRIHMHSAGPYLARDAAAIWNALHKSCIMKGLLLICLKEAYKHMAPPWGCLVTRRG